MFGLGTTELILILVIVMVLFGAKKLPALGEGLAKGIKSFRTNISMEDKDKDKIPENDTIDADVSSAEKQPEKKKEEMSS
ncbi:MAG: twin-arginine translocase TatA/TatE family subunit [Ghiorsea sp.]|nr:twin-arginine translocase TatA/TatE family subunit [Ghiorsea sp.]